MAASRACGFDGPGREERMTHTIVIFGASGDLTSRKLVPALYSLARAGTLPAGTRVIGVREKPTTRVPAGTRAA